MQQLKANTSKQLLLTNYAILTNELNPTTQFLRNQPSLGARTEADQAWTQQINTLSAEENCPSTIIPASQQQKQALV